jgi:hypothetical protein
MKKIDLIQKIIIFLLSFSPLIYWGILATPAITGKFLFFTLLIIISTVLLFTKTYLSKKIILPDQKFLIAYIFFLVINFIADIQGVNPIRSLIGSPSRFDGFLTALGFFFFLLILINVLKTRKDWFLFGTINIFVGLIICLISLLQYFGILETKPVTSQINIIWALLTPRERNDIISVFQEEKSGFPAAAGQTAHRAVPDTVRHSARLQE